MSKRIVYKLTGQDLSSAIITNEAKIQYAVEKWVRPKIKGSKILCFTTEEQAKVFAEGQMIRILKLWKAEAMFVTPVKTLIFSESTMEDFIRMWINRKGKGYWKAPEGTLGCSQLKLLEEIALC